MKSSEAKRPAWVAETFNAANWDVLRPYALIAAVAVITLASCTMGHTAPVTCDKGGCSDWTGAKQVQIRHVRHRAIDANGNAVVIGRRPRGCPRRYCGCFASLEVFGKIIPELNLAANWARKFPRTSPAPGMVAARSGHVFVLKSHVEGRLWVVLDGNSGGGLTREHIRSIDGFKIVNPHGSYAER